MKYILILSTQTWKEKDKKTLTERKDNFFFLTTIDESIQYRYTVYNLPYRRL